MKTDINDLDYLTDDLSSTYLAVNAGNQAAVRFDNTVNDSEVGILGIASTDVSLRVEWTTNASGAIDFEEKLIITAAADLKKMGEKLRAMGIEVVEERLAMRVKQPVMLNNEDEVIKIMSMVEELEDNDDVINVFAGFDYHE